MKMTTDPSVKQNVVLQAKRMVKPGCPITRGIWKAAYEIVRLNEIEFIRNWKQKYITIERT